jgi:hypothetical protein
MKYIFLPESAGTRTARRLHEELETAWECLEARLRASDEILAALGNWA